MTPAFELPTDWFVENDGQGLVLDPEKVQAVFTAKQEIEDELRAELAIAECLATEANGGMTAMTFSQRAVEAAAESVLECRARMAASFDSPDPTEIAYDEFLARAALNAALAVDGVALVPKAALGVLMEKTEHFDDEGPLHEGWQSDELRGARAEIERSLAAASEGEERR